jgi:DNA processing protein
MILSAAMSTDTDHPSPEQRLDCLQLARSRGVGPALFFELIERYGSPAAAIERLGRSPRSPRFAAIELASRDSVLEELEKIDAAGANLVTAFDADYPYRLRHIADPPPVLTVRGDVSRLRTPSVGIVGARNASANGCRFARALSGGLADNAITIVSGLARGIDTAAHGGCIAHGGVTIAAIASGADITYPPENRELMMKIIETGAVVSERPWGAIAKAQHFPRRNRVIAGLSLATIVVEAALRSGSLITARLAAESGREVMAVPGTPTDERHRGTNRLLRDGAHFVEHFDDVLNVIKPLIRNEEMITEPPARRVAKTVESARPAVEAVAANTDETTQAARPGSLQESLKDAILGLLSPEPVAVDELIRQCHSTPPGVLDVLLELEMDGRIDRHTGNRVSLSLR